MIVLIAKTTGGISVTATASRKYGKIVKNRIGNRYKELKAKERVGFGAGRFTLNHIFTIAKVRSKKSAVNQEVHPLYVACDSHFLLWEALEEN